MPSLAVPVPVIENTASSGVPAIPIVSLMVVVTLSASESTLTLMPVGPVALERSTVKVSSPSAIMSSVSIKSITKSVIVSPSLVAVNVNVVPSKASVPGPL